VDERKQAMDGALFVEDPEELGEDDRDAARAPRGHAGDGKAERAAEVLADILRKMALDARVTIREDGERVVLDVDGPDAGRAIGKKGQALDALQFLVNKIVNRFPEGRRHIVVDSGDYRQRHDEGLMSMARREAKRAVQIGKVISLEPMPPRDRRVIHMSLAKFPGVTTKSNGEGAQRRIQIIPARTRAAGEGGDAAARGGGPGGVAPGGGRRRRRGGRGGQGSGRGGAGPRSSERAEDERLLRDDD
jgi:spoIIIJ-associated protein